MPQIFPTSITQFSVEGLIKAHSTTSKIIYWVLIIAFALLLLSLFFIKVDVSINSSGIITSKEQATSIKAAVYGNVQVFKLSENQYVGKGDTLMITDTSDIAKNIAIIQAKIKQISEQNTDLAYLSSIKQNIPNAQIKLQTEWYAQELKKFISDLKFQKLQIEILKKDYKRQLQLYKKEAISASEYETSEYKLQNEELKYKQLFNNQLAMWQASYNGNKTQLLSLSEQLISLQKELKKYFIISPLSGYVQEIKGIKQAGLVYPNQEICTINPAESLIVETYVSTSDIGFVQTQQKVKFRVDAFNFNEWGMLTGNVYEIAKDVSLPDNKTPSFRVRCTLNKRSLRYHDKEVVVKKGMTLQANFFLIRRTLAQMFYDKLSDWLDPKTAYLIEN